MAVSRSHQALWFANRSALISKFDEMLNAGLPRETLVLLAIDGTVRPDGQTFAEALDRESAARVLYELAPGFASQLPPVTAGEWLTVVVTRNDSGSLDRMVQRNPGGENDEHGLHADRAVRSWSRLNA